MKHSTAHQAQKRPLHFLRRDSQWWLDPIPPAGRARAVAALDSGDVLGFLILADNTTGLDLVLRNAFQLDERGLYERALLMAFSSTRLTYHPWPLRVLRDLFGHADPAALRAAGDPLPHTSPYTLYRAVSGHGAARRLRGLSWTSSRKVAQWFAERAALVGRHDPAVMQCTLVDDEHIAACSNGRNEAEFILLLPPSVRITRVDIEIEPVRLQSVALH